MTSSDEQPPPKWWSSSPVLWDQDECAPDAENVDAAWLRLFGEAADKSKAVEHFDDVYTAAWLMPNNHVYGCDASGGYILGPVGAYIELELRTIIEEFDEVDTAVVIYDFASRKAKVTFTGSASRGDVLRAIDNRVQTLGVLLRADVGVRMTINVSKKPTIP